MAQALQAIVPSSTFLFLTCSLLDYKVFNSCMQSKICVASFSWSSLFSPHWTTEYTVNLITVKCSNVNIRNLKFWSEIGPSKFFFSLLCFAFPILKVSVVWNKEIEKAESKGHYHIAFLCRWGCCNQFEYRSKKIKQKKLFALNNFSKITNVFKKSSNIFASHILFCFQVIR